VDRPLAILLRDLRQCGPPLATAGLHYRGVAFAVLTPLVGLLLRSLLTLSERTVLADLDIALVLLQPAAWLGVVAVTAAALTVVVLEQACFLAGAAAAQEDPDSRPLQALTRDDWGYRFEAKRVQFDADVRGGHRVLRMSAIRFLRESSVLNLLTAPVIYSLIVPFVILDV
jgi:hypothetical protein